MTWKKLLPFRGARLTNINNLDPLRNETDTDIHIRPIEDILEELQIDPKVGFSSLRAQELSLEQGPNALSPALKTSEFLKLCRCLCGGFSLLIWVRIIDINK